MSKLLILILNYKDWTNTEECLKTVLSLKAPATLKTEVVVIDNSPEKQEINSIKAQFPKVKLIKNKTNLGFAEGNNVGIRWGLERGFDYFLILNNDTLVDKNLLIQLIKVVKKDRNIGIISPKIYFAPGFEFHYSRYKKSERGKVIWYAGGIIDWDNVIASHRGVDEVDKGQFNQEEKTDFATGCCMLVRRKVFEKIGLFDKRYFLYLEDVDLCQRAKKVGFKIFYVPQGELWHKNAGSSKVGSPLHDYYLTRNRMLFGMKFAAPRAKLALLREGLKLLYKGRGGQKKGIRDFFTFHFGKK